MTTFETKLCHYMTTCHLCRFCRRTEPLAKCTMQPDPVPWSCYIQRIDEMACGPEARWFQAMEVT